MLVPFMVLLKELIVLVSLVLVTILLAFIVAYWIAMSDSNFPSQSKSIDK